MFYYNDRRGGVGHRVGPEGCRSVMGRVACTAQQETLSWPLPPLCCCRRPGALGAESGPVIVPVTRDTWVSAVGTEREGNNGASPRLKFKGIQEFSLVDGDFSALKGRRIQRAVLRLHKASEERLWRVTVSTISAPWEEGTGTNYAKVPGAACFRLPGVKPDITAVILGNGGSIWRFADASDPDADGWQSIPVDPAVIQARIDGRSHGFAVIDDVGNEWTRQGDAFHWRPFPNRFFHSKDQNASVAPRFEIWVADGEPVVVPPSPAPPPLAEPKRIDLPAIAAPEEENVPQRSMAVGDLFGRPLAVLRAARGETVWLDLRAEAGAKLDLRVPDGFSGRLFSVEAHGDALVPCDRSGKPLVPERTDPHRQTGQWLAEIFVPKSARAGRHMVRLAAGLRGAAGSVGLRAARPALLRPADERLRPARRAGDRLLPPGPRTSELPELPAVLVARARSPTAAPRRRLRTDRGTGRRGTAASGRSWTVPPSPICPAEPVPVDNFYLPLNENWPMDHERAYRGGYWIENAYPDSYWAEFRAASAAVRPAHRGKGLDARRPSSSTSTTRSTSRPSEGRGRDAPRRGSSTSRSIPRTSGRCAGSAANSSPRPAARGTSSSAATSRGPSGSGTCSTASAARRSSAERCGRIATASWPGRRGTGRPCSSTAARTRSARPNIQCSAWCLDAWCLGADGVVPWNTIGTARSWTEPDQTCLFYPTEKGPLPSLRLKAFCHGQQLVEYLVIFTQLAGHDRRSVAEALRRELGLDGLLKKTSEDDAGTMSYDRPLAGKPRTGAIPPRLVDRRPEARRPQVVDRAAPLRPRRCADGRELLRLRRRFARSHTASLTSFTFATVAGNRSERLGQPLRSVFGVNEPGGLGGVAWPPSSRRPNRGSCRCGSRRRPPGRSP